MTEEQVNQLIDGLNTPDLVKQKLKGALKKANIYDKLSLEEFQKQEDVQGKIGFFFNAISIEVAKTKEQQKIIDHIKQEMIPHVKTSIASSNVQIDDNNYEFSCAIKAFCIEYMLKCIYTLINAKNERNKQEPIDQIVQTFLKTIKNDLPSDHRHTGHEINEILNTLIPPYIRNVINYKTITNSLDSNVKEQGKLIDKDSSLSLDNFIIDYFTMIHPLTEEEKESLKDFSAYFKSLNQKNNTAFIDLRYLNGRANKEDYEMLNCLMVATYMTLNLLLDCPELIRDSKYDRTIPYDDLKDYLSPEEYQNILMITKDNHLEANTLITYTAFLKYYLGAKTPSLNIRRLGNATAAIKTVNAENNALTKSKHEIEKDLDPSKLSRQEIKELMKIAPDYVYNSLSYNDKLIYKKCEASGIEFEYYYKINPNLFSLIASNYSDVFKNKSIDVKMFLQDEEEAMNKLSVLCKLNFPDGIPSYYFDYDATTIALAFQLEQNPNKVMKREDLEVAFSVLSAAKYLKLEISGDSLVNTAAVEALNHVAAFLNLSKKMYDSAKESDKELIQKRIEGVKENIIDENNYPVLTISEEEYNRLKRVVKLLDFYKIDQIEPFLTLSPEALESLENSTIVYGSKEAEDLIRNGEEFSLKHKKMSSPKTTLPVIASIDGPIKDALIRTIHVVLQSSEIEKDMAPLKSREEYTNYASILALNKDMKDKNYPVDESLKPGLYLFYKKNEEVEKIANLYRDYSCTINRDDAIPFQGELLYFPIEILERHFSEILDKIDDKHCYGENFTVENATFLSQKLIEKDKRAQASPKNPYIPTIYKTETAESDALRVYQNFLDNNSDFEQLTIPGFFDDNKQATENPHKKR